MAIDIKDFPYSAWEDNQKYCIKKVIPRLRVTRCRFRGAGGPALSSTKKKKKRGERERKGKKRKGERERETQRN